jgi:hypothetical protein
MKAISNKNGQMEIIPTISSPSQYQPLEKAALNFSKKLSLLLLPLASRI